MPPHVTGDGHDSGSRAVTRATSSSSSSLLRRAQGGAPTPSSSSPPRCGAVEHTFAEPQGAWSSSSSSQQQQQQQRWYTSNGSGSHAATSCSSFVAAYGGTTTSASTETGNAFVARLRRVRGAFYDVHRGFAVRLLSASLAACLVGYAVYRGVLAPMQQSRPLAQRVWWCTPRVLVTLLSKEHVGSPDSEMYVFRFALPNSYDTTGYAPISSVQLIMRGSYGTWLQRQHQALYCRRWYTPISHPDRRGVIEFVIRLHPSGYMSRQLRELVPGDVMQLGRWRREFAYTANTHGEVGLLCSTAGISVALQLMRVVAHNPADHTRVRLLYCTQDSRHIAFRHGELHTLAHTQPSRFCVAYNVMNRMPLTAAAAAARNTVRTSASTSDVDDDGGGDDSAVYTGLLTSETIAVTMPPPQLAVPASSLAGHRTRATMTRSPSQQQQQQQHDDDDEARVVVRPPILVCGPPALMTPVCGLPLTMYRNSYAQGPWYYYRGLLKDMGYRRSQVYKFGVTTPR